MKAILYMATHNKNDLLPNTLYSIARQKVPFPFEVCIVDDHSDVDPEPIIREFIPDAKYLRLEKQVGFDVVTTYALSLASSDTDVLIMQSADVIHYNIDTIEQLCNNVSEKTICMAAVSNTDPPHGMYKDFEKHLPIVLKQWKTGKARSGSGGGPGGYYFFLGAIRRIDYEALKCVKKPHCDNILKHELIRNGFKLNYPKGLRGFHQHHDTTTVPCASLSTCTMACPLKNRCKILGWNNLEDYLNWKKKN